MSMPTSHPGNEARFTALEDRELRRRLALPPARGDASLRQRLPLPSGIETGRAPRGRRPGLAAGPATPETGPPGPIGDRTAWSTLRKLAGTDLRLLYGVELALA